MTLSESTISNLKNLSALTSIFGNIKQPENFEKKLQITKNDKNEDITIIIGTSCNYISNNDIKYNKHNHDKIINQVETSSCFEDPAFFADWYLRLGACQRRILQFLYHNFLRYGENSYPSIATIAKFAKCSERHVKSFNAKCRWLGINTGFQPVKILSQYLHGKQTTNRYKINNYLKCAMTWLKFYGYLNAPFYKVKYIISSMQKEGKNILKFTPKCFQSSPNNDSSYKDCIRSHKPIKEFLKDVPIKDEALIYCSGKYSDFVLNEAKRSTLFAIDKKMIKKTPEAFFIGSCKAIERKLIFNNNCLTKL